MMRLVSAFLLVGATSAWAMEDFYAPQRVSLIKADFRSITVNELAKLSVEGADGTTTHEINMNVQGNLWNVAMPEEFLSISLMKAALYDRYCYGEVEVDAQHSWTNTDFGSGYMRTGKRKMKLESYNAYYKVVGDDAVIMIGGTCDHP
ncbi:MAG: hypothetical protein NTV34_14695 [Proteobacteria bacterium]|nr:hypothetical protein [Pseudomonadota bacterium]